MTFKPTIAKTELVTIARCPRCSGTRLFCIAKYMRPDDYKTLERLKCAGYTAESGALCQLQNVDDCACRPEDVKHHTQRSSLNSGGTRRILSLKKLETVFTEEDINAQA